MNQNYRQKFYDIYSKEILLHKDEIRQIKVKLLSVFYLLCVVSCLVFLAIFCVKYILLKIIIAVIFPVLLLCIYNYRLYAQKKYKNFFKNIFYPYLSYIFPEIKWCIGSFIQDFAITQSDLFGFNNIRSCDDSFAGVYNGVNYAIAECELKYQDNDKYAMFRVFKGIIISLDFNKNFSGQTIVTSKNDKSVKNDIVKKDFYFFRLTFPILIFSFAFGISFGSKIIFIISAIVAIILVLMLAYLWFSNCNFYQKVKLEDVEFDKNFKVWASDQIESRYLVTPAFMERFKSLETAFGANKIKCSFFDNKLMFAITTNKDLFEIGSLFTSIKNSKQIDVFLEEITSIYKMIDHFNLNERSGL